MLTRVAAWEMALVEWSGVEDTDLELLQPVVSSLAAHKIIGATSVDFGARRRASG